MSLLSVFKRWRPFEYLSDTLKPIIKVLKQGPLTYGQGRDNFETPSINFEEIERAYYLDSYIRKSIDKYINLMFKAGWNIVGKNENAIQYINLRLNLMSYVTNVPTELFFVGLAEDFVKYHNVFLVKGRVQNGFNVNGIKAMPYEKRGVVGAYFRVSPLTMSIERDKDGTILSYRQTINGETKDFKAEDVIHIYFNRASGTSFGIPYVYAVLDDVRLLRQIEENVGLLIYRHLFPLLHYKIGGKELSEEPTEEEIEDVYQTITNMPVDGALITSGRVEMDAIKISTFNAEPYLDYFENRVFSGLGVSQVAMGRGDSSSRSTADNMAIDMYDQEKAYQKVLSSFIDLHIVNELLLEGGFDPITKPDDDVDFIFNEIDTDYLVKKENHEVFKFEHNIQTWEETRRRIGLEPAVDENRLFYKMISIPLAQVNSEISTDDTDNRNEPTNQYSQKNTPEMVGMPIQVVCSNLCNKYRGLMQDISGIIKQYSERTNDKNDYNLSLLIKEIKELTSLAFMSYKSYLIDEMYAVFKKGYLQAAKDCEEQIVVSSPLFPHELRLHSYFYFDKLKNDTDKLIESRIAEQGVDNIDIYITSIFDSIAYRLKVIVSDELVRSYNCGYTATGQ